MSHPQQIRARRGAYSAAAQVDDDGARSLREAPAGCRTAAALAPPASSMYRRRHDLLLRLTGGDAPAAIGLRLLVRDGQTLETLARHAVGFGYEKNRPRTDLVQRGWALSLAARGCGSSDPPSKAAVARTAVLGPVDPAEHAGHLPRAPPSSPPRRRGRSPRATRPPARRRRTELGEVTCVVPRVNLTERQLLARRGADVPVAVSVNARGFAWRRRSTSTPRRRRSWSRRGVLCGARPRRHGGRPRASLRGVPPTRCASTATWSSTQRMKDSPQGGIVRCHAAGAVRGRHAVAACRPSGARSRWRSHLAQRPAVRTTTSSYGALCASPYVEPEPPTVIHPSTIGRR